MSRFARASRSATTWITGLVLAAAMAPSAHAQSLGGISGTMTAGLASSYPADWQRTNTFASMNLFNSTQETVTADIKVSLVRDGQEVATTPQVQRLYPVGGFAVPTPDVTRWQTMLFSGKVGDAVDMTGRLPDGVYTVCVDISNVKGTQSGALYTGFSQCATFFSFFPKPPNLVAPMDGGLVSTPSPVFQWTPVLSNLGGRLPHFFRLVEIYPGQTPERAIEANRALFEQVFGFNMPGGDVSSFPYPASAPVFLTGHRYAWRVQALLTVGTSGNGTIGTTLSSRGGASITSYNAKPLGENEGRSKVYTFIWNPDPLAASKGINPNAAPTEGEYRMGNVWSPAGNGSTPRYQEGAGRFSPDGDEASNAPRLNGVANGEESNFADRLAHAMASLWKQGPGAAVRIARSGGDGTAVPIASAAGRTAPGGAAPSPAAATAAHSESETRIAAAPDPGSDAATTTTAQAGAVADSTAQAIVTPPPPPPAAPTSESGFGPDWARLHGTASLTGEAYSSDGLASPNRPDRSSRVVTGLSVGVIKDQMRIPVSALVSDDQVAFRQNINQVAVAPRFRWAGITAGNFSPQFSSYTLADATLLGGGLELAPKQWHMGFVSGRARKAITQTAELGVTPQFERNMTAGHIGLGNPMTNSVDFSILRATDDANSIAGAESTLTLTPEGNTVYSVKAQGLMPSRHLRAIVETALSKYDRDRRADASSVDGHAMGVQLFHETGLTRVGVKAEYLNGGFMTLGNSGITGDRVDGEVNARVQLMQGRLAVEGSAGARNDAVSQALAAETRRRNYGLNTSWNPGMRFGIDAQTAIYSNESDATDSLFLGNSNTTRIYSVAPRTMWKMRGVQNSLTCSASLQKSENGGPIADTKSLSLIGNWAAQIGAPLSEIGRAHV